jgi:hypothetical protein
MIKKSFFPVVIFFFITIFFINPFVIQNKFPIPSDTIIGLYHPFRDLYSREYPNGIPYKNSLITDPVRQQYPWRNMAIETFKRYELPVWNPYVFSGTPLLANFQAAALYPLNGLFLGLPFAYAWSVLVIMQPLLAGIFMYLFLSNLKLSKSSSFIGACSFSFSGFMTAWFEWGTIGHTALWLPLVLFSIDKIFTEFSYSKISNFVFGIFNKQISIQKKIVWSGIFLFGLASSFFAGHLQTFFYLILVAFAYIIFRWFQFGRQRKILYLFLTLFSLFLILTVAQLYPSLYFIASSARGVDLLWQKPGWFIPWEHSIQFVAPDFFGNPTTLNYWGEWNYGEFIGYIGIVPLLMSLYALLFRKDREVFFFGTVLFISLLFAFPTGLAKIPYILQVPFLSSAQPSRMLFLSDFSLAVLAGLGLELFLRHKRRRNIFAIMGIASIIFLLLWYFVFGGFGSANTFSSQDILTAKRNLYLPTLLFLSSGILFMLILFIKKIKYRNYVIVALLALSIFDQYRFFHKFTPFTESSYLFPRTKTLSYLQNQEGIFRIMTTDDRILPPNFSMMYKLQTVDGYDPLYLLRYGELMAAVKRNKPDISLPFGFNRIIAIHNYDSHVMDLLGVRYVLSLSDINSPKLKKVFQEGETRVYENSNVFQRAFFVEETIVAKSKKDAIDKVFDLRNDLRKTAIIEYDRHDGDVNLGKNWATGSAKIIEYSENKVIIDIEIPYNMDKPLGFLVLTDSFYPTWRAKIINKQYETESESSIIQTNYNFRGIIVPHGKHRVEFYNNLF